MKWKKAVVISGEEIQDLLGRAAAKFLKLESSPQIAEFDWHFVGDNCKSCIVSFNEDCQEEEAQLESGQCHEGSVMPLADQTRRP